MALTNYSNQMIIIVFVNFYAIFSDRLLVRAQSFCHIVVALVNIMTYQMCLYFLTYISQSINRSGGTCAITRVHV